jgi:hypothetical protein
MKKIKELAEKAGIIVTPANGFDRSTISVNEIKFAKLIIQDCIDAVMEGDRHRREYFAESIRERFGIPAAPKKKQSDLIKLLAEKVKAHGHLQFLDVPTAEWPDLIDQIKTLTPIDSGYGTHCHNDVYQIGDWEYDFTYESDSIGNTPIIISRRKTLT